MIRNTPLKRFDWMCRSNRNSIQASSALNRRLCSSLVDFGILTTTFSPLFEGEVKTMNTNGK
jgi:hypothetical protein